MKKILSFLACLIPSALLAANPTFSSFDTNQFKVSEAANTISITAELASNTPANGTGGNIVNNGYSFVQGGAPLILDNQASGATLNGQLWGAMKTPWKFIYVGELTNSTTSGSYSGETNALYVITNLVYSGRLAAITNDGSTVCLYFDVGWDGPRNTNWNWILRNNGTLMPDTNRFPDGIAYVCNYAHTNGLNVAFQMYGTTNILPLGASEELLSIQTGAVVYYTNGIGTIPNDSFGHYVIISTADAQQLDAQELVYWGADAVVLCDFAGGGLSSPGFAQTSYSFGRSLLQDIVPLGWNQTFPATYNTYTTNTVNTNYPGQFYPAQPMSLVLGKLPAFFALESPNTDQNYTMGLLTRQNHTGAFYDNTAQGQGAAGLRSISRDFAGTQYANNGAYVVWMWSSDSLSLIAEAISHGISSPGYTNSPEWYGTWVPVYSAMTNAGWNRIHGDPQQNWFTLLQDIGTNSTQFAGSIWGTKLFDGNWGVAVFNESGNTVPATNFTVKWKSLGLNTNAYVHVYDPYNGFDFGTNQNSLTLNLSYGTGRLLQFDVLPIQQIPQLILSGTTNPPLELTFGKTVSNPTQIPVGTAVYGVGQGLSATGYNLDSAVYLGYDNNAYYGAVFAAMYNSNTHRYAAMGVENASSPVWGIQTDENGNAQALGSLTVSNLVTAATNVLSPAFTIVSNSWSAAALANYTNSMPNYSSAFISSNGYPVLIYRSNNTFFVNYILNPSGGILP